MQNPEHESIAKRLEMAHLKATDELKREAEESATQAEHAEPPRPPDPRTEREYTFHFRHETPKRVFEGTFTSEILSLGQKRLIGIMRARLTGNTPYDALDEYTRELTFLVAHLTYALKDKDRPAWAKDFQLLDDLDVLQALYEEVAKHERIFRG